MKTEKLIKNRKIKVLISLLLSSFLFFSCTSIKDPEDVFTGIDYTQEDARKEEQKRIRELLEKNAVQALWRACLLKDDETISECEEKLVSEYDEAVNKEDWFNALRIASSFSTIGSKSLSKLSKSLSELEKLSIKDVPGLGGEKSSSKGKPSSYINGTVTIWVDKGIKIERGMGFADRVIGSGFFISKNGYIVTNHHVIA
ncbi:MAG: serine protease, partial [Treponema sp.]|nr:serine protease [Treponema sp.]